MEALLSVTKRKLLKETGNMHLNVTLRRLRETIFPVEKQCVTYSEFMFVVLVIQLAKRMRRILSLSVACPNVQYFSTLSHQRHDLKKKVLKIKYAF
jgi:hypothetical protein